MVQDVFLEDVNQAFKGLAKLRLRPFLRALMKEDPASRPADVHELALLKTILRQLLRLQWRSQDVRSEFARFYCLRLLLDEQSPLATYFIDLFCQLEWLLRELLAACLPSPNRRFNLDGNMVLRPLLRLVQPVADTCRLLYVAYMILPRSERIQDLEEQQKIWRGEVKRKGTARGRQFTGDKMHCRMRELGFTNLDQPRKSMIKLEETALAEGTFARVYKGVFEAEHGSDTRNLQKTIIGRPVAVKMPKDGSESEENGLMPTIRLLHTMDQQQETSSEIGEHDVMGDDVLNREELNRLNRDVGNAELRDELSRLVSIKHPNIVAPIGYIGKRTQGDCGLVMELMDGSLYDYLEKVKKGSEPPLQELDMLDLMLEIAKGMQFLHENNLIHRDLKPSNVLLRFLADTDLGCNLLEVKIADFGITKRHKNGRESTRHTTGRGTSCYMAPEVRVFSTKEVELAYPEKIDVFSFGTTCFNILIGDPDARAFSKSVKAFYEAVRTGEWKEWMQGSIHGHLHYLVKLIGKCWEPDPAMRPTFATLCLLLQHAMRCHVSATSLHNALGAAATVQATNLQAFVKKCKAQRAKTDSPVFSDYLEQMADKFLRDDGSQLSRNELIQCRMRELGFTNLDWSGQISTIKVRTRKVPGTRKVHKGVFEVEHGSDRNRKTITVKCQNLDPTMRPRFATLRLLLQDAINQCHVSANKSLHNALGTSATTSAQATNLQIFMKSCKAQRPKSYSPIISDYLKYHSGIGLRVVENCLLDFQSAVAADGTVYCESINVMAEALEMELVQVAEHILLSGLICNEDEDEILSRGLVCNEDEDDAAAAPNYVMKSSSDQVMESCLEKADPLIFMKALPCHILAKRYLKMAETDSQECIVGCKFERPSQHFFNFEGDDAHSQLDVDTSLIPLLVVFWT